MESSQGVSTQEVEDAMGFTYFGAILLTAWLVFLGRSLPGLLRAVALTPRPGTNSQKDQPSVSVVFAARNEARSLPGTLASLRQQTWSNLQVIAVDDRSTDETGRILDEAAAVWPKLQVIHIAELPAGWLGKTHALQIASQNALGDWLLFTDADVQFARDAVGTAIHYAETTQLDHLALSPKLIANGFWLRTAVYFFLYNVVLVFRPQDADRPKSSASVGIGAFNLVRKRVYEQVGGHGAVALRPDEDLALGRVIKHAGFKQVFAGGSRLLSVEWYQTLSEMAHGLEKNALAPFQYRFWRFTLAVFTMLVFFDGPLAGTAMAPGWVKGLFAIALFIQVLLFHMTRRYSDMSFWWALTSPLAAPILFVILVRSGLLCAVRGGIHWRGTYYSLQELRKNQP
jgi:cellulose synthase/poly-beta-1,6-N-acetylglucosamine synthase-like glycosyltransferase